MKRIQESLTVCGAALTKWSQTRTHCGEKAIAKKAARLRLMQANEDGGNIAEIK